MPISGNVNRLISCGNANYATETRPVRTPFKTSFLGRAVYRVGYPFRQLISNTIMAPCLWVKSAVEGTQKALGDRSCQIKAPLTVLAGTGAFIGGLTVGIAVSCTYGFWMSVVDAVCEDDVDALDTMVERKMNRFLEEALGAYFPDPRCVVATVESGVQLLQSHPENASTRSPSLNVTPSTTSGQ